MSIDSFLDRIELDLEKEALKSKEARKKLRKFRKRYGTGYVLGAPKLPKS
jgi:hypothetical protein